MNLFWLLNEGTCAKRVLLTAPSMMRTMSHLKVQMLMSEGGQRRGTWVRVHKGHRKMARNPVSSSWLSQPGHTRHRAPTDVKAFLRAEAQHAKKRLDDSRFSEANWVQTTVCWGFTANQTPSSKSIIRLPAQWPHLSAMSCSQFNQDHVSFK